MRRFFLLASAFAVFFTTPAHAVQISSYPSAGTLTGAEIIPAVRSGAPGGFQTNPAALATYDQTHLPGTPGQLLFNSAGVMTTISPASTLTLLGLAPVASSGLYSDLTGKPTIPSAQVNSDWNAVSGLAQILNKPSLSTVATSGAYSDLSGRPTIPAAQVNSDWNSVSGLSQILNKPSLASVATTGAYSSLTGTPTLGTASAAATGTSGATLGLLNANLTFSGTDTFTGVTTINRNAAALPAARTGTVLQAASADTVVTRLEADAFAAPGFFSVVRENGTAASPTALQAGDELGGLNAYGHNGTAIVGPQASFRSYAAQNWTTGATGTYADIAITPINTTTLTSAIRFESDTGITVPPAVIGGDMGAGTINAVGLYVGGSPVMTPSTKATMTKQQNFGTATLTDAATIAWNLDTAQVAKIILGGNRTMAAPTNMVDGGTYVLRVTQDTTGSRTITWNTVFKWPGGTAPTLSTGAGKFDLITFVSDGTFMYGTFALDER